MADYNLMMTIKISIHFWQYLFIDSYQKSLNAPKRSGLVEKYYKLPIKMGINTHRFLMRDLGYL
jgi:hypothetical protein